MATLTFTPSLSLAPNRLGGEYREPGGDSLCKANYKEHDGSGGANCRQGIGTYETAYDNRVRHIIKLLKNVSDNKRKHKFQDHRQWLAFGHVFFHSKPLLFQKICTKSFI